MKRGANGLRQSIPFALRSSKVLQTRKRAPQMIYCPDQASNEAQVLQMHLCLCVGV